MNPAASASRSMCASTNSAWPPLASISAATRLPRSTSRSANTTFAPSATNRRTVASPMPDAPPVTAAIFPLSRSMPHAPPGVFSRVRALREPDQRVLDAPVDLDALAGEALALPIRALAGDADLVDTLLPRRRLDRGDLRGQGAPVVFRGHEQIWLERDEQVPRALLIRHPTTEHAERVHGEGQRVALVPAEGQDRAASRGARVRGGAAVLVDRHAFGQRNAEALPELEIRAPERGGAQTDHPRPPLHREAATDWLGAESRPGAAQRGDHGRSGHRVSPERAAPVHHADVVGAAAR